MVSGRKKKSKAKMSRKSNTASAVVAVAAGGPTPQAVLDNTFALGVALQNQSLDTARWTADQVGQWTDERREVMLLHQQLEAPTAKLHGFTSVELLALTNSGTVAGQSVIDARGPATMQAALTTLEPHKTALQAAV